MKSPDPVPAGSRAAPHAAAVSVTDLTAEVERLLAGGEPLMALRFARASMAGNGRQASRSPELEFAVARALALLGRDDEAIEALSAMPDGDSAETTVATAMLAELRVVTGRADGVGEAAAALRVALAGGQPASAVVAARSLESARYYAGDVSGAVATAEATLEWLELRDAESSLRREAELDLGIQAMHADDFERSAALLGGVAASAPSDRLQTEATLHRAFLDFHAGRWDAAEAELAAGLRRNGLPEWLAGLTSGVLALIHIHRDDLEAAQHVLDLSPTALASAPRPMQLWAEMLLAEARGERDRAAAAAERLARVTELLRSPARFRLYGPDVVRLLAAAGDLVTAGRVVLALDGAATASHVHSIRASARLSRGLLDGDPHEIGLAAEELEDGPRLFDAALARQWEGDALVRAGRSADAAAAYERAAVRFADIGADRWVRIADRALRALGRRPGRRGPRGRPSTGWAALTATERQVAELVGLGLRNGAIAERLVLSRRTVEGHLSRIFLKLGVESRTRVAVIAVRAARQPQPPDAEA